MLRNGFKKVPADGDMLELDYSTCYDSKNSADKSSADGYMRMHSRTQKRKPTKVSPTTTSCPQDPFTRVGEGTDKRPDARNRPQDSITSEEQSDAENAPERH